MLRFHYAPAPIRNKERLCGLTDYLQKKICPLVYLSAPPVPGHGANPAANKFETVIELDSRDVLSVESQLENVTTPETWLADVQKIQAEIVGKGIDAIVTEGIDETARLLVLSMTIFGAAKISTVCDGIDVISALSVGIDETAILLPLSKLNDGIEETTILLPLSRLTAGIDEISAFNAGIEETVVVDSTDSLGIAVIVTGPSAKAVPEEVPESVDSSSALLHTLSTTAKTQTSNNCHRRFIQDSDMIDPLIDVNKHPPEPTQGNNTPLHDRSFDLGFLFFPFGFCGNLNLHLSPFINRSPLVVIK